MSGLGDLIEKRIGKYTRDLNGHISLTSSSQCCCDGCRNARAILGEYEYLKMAARHEAALRARTGSAETWSDEPHSRGEDDHDNGKPLSANPYSPGSTNGSEWEIGWRQARHSRRLEQQRRRRASRNPPERG